MGCIGEAPARNSVKAACRRSQAKAVKAPQARGTLIDAARISSWVGRFPGYRVAVTSERVKAWLARFKDEDKDLAARLLDSVEFLTHHDLDRALQQSLGGLVSSVAGWCGKTG